ncbi:MAG: hypothetical protein ACKPJD_04460 [Planctomycetaceae bacterium]
MSDHTTADLHRTPRNQDVPTGLNGVAEPRSLHDVDRPPPNPAAAAGANLPHLNRTVPEALPTLPEAMSFVAAPF